MTCTVEVVADSIAAHGIRLTSLKLRYWRAIHAEFMTHRVFSRNASSSRAIPVKRMLQQVWNDPAGPIHWGANQAGMQANAELTGWRNNAARFLWRSAGRVACVFAWGLMKVGLHKQVANRLLEPWQYINVLVTATEWENFFALRCHPDAQPEIQELAKAIRDAMRGSKPKFLKEGEWHLPYITEEETSKHGNSILVKVSTARNARTSYLTFDGKPSKLTEDVKLHDKLVGAEPLHASPAEHPATPMETGNFCHNFRGWRQYRDFLENQVELPMSGDVTHAALAELETPPAPEAVDRELVGTTGKIIDLNGVQVAAHYNNHPSGVEAIELCRCMNFNVGNAFKYVFRRDEKPEYGLTLQESIAKNLDKALWYIRDEIATYETTPVSYISNPGRFRLLIEKEPHSKARQCYIDFETLCDLGGASLYALKALELSILQLKRALT